jgi:hypothetical protein
MPAVWEGFPPTLQRQVAHEDTREEGTVFVQAGRLQQDVYRKGKPQGMPTPPFPTTSRLQPWTNTSPGYRPTKTHSILKP